MATEQTFDIDDEKSVDDNLKSLGQLLAQMDATLAARLSPELIKMSEASTPDYGSILDALFAATDVEDQSSEQVPGAGGQQS